MQTQKRIGDGVTAENRGASSNIHVAGDGDVLSDFVLQRATYIFPPVCERMDTVLAEAETAINVSIYNNLEQESRTWAS
jgi:hypothetical protein